MNRNQTAAPHAVRVTGPWNIEVAGRAFAVAPSEIVTVAREPHSGLPLFDPSLPGWRRGQCLLHCQSQETSVKHAVVPGSLKVYSSADAEAPLKEGPDYRFDSEWAVVGRTPGGAIGEQQPVWLSYQYGLSRLDAVVETAAGEIAVRPGTGHVCVPLPPAAGPGERALAHLWISSRLAGLTGDNVFPILETRCPEPPALTPDEARRRLPKTWKILEAGGPLRILAWGDSVTDAAYLKEREGYPDTRWQEQFATRLRRRFPKAKIELTTSGWGGRSTKSFVEAPPDSPYHYETAILGAKPDLVVSEFVNDAYLGDPAALEKAYGKFLEDFRRIGAEWIIHTPHYVRPDWMGLQREKEIDDDPRPYVAALHGFCARHEVPLSDASRRWGRLWRQGIPYTTLLLNAINHPDERGMAIFADSLMRYFP